MTPFDLKTESYTPPRHDFMDPSHRHHQVLRRVVSAITDAPLTICDAEEVLRAAKMVLQYTLTGRTDTRIDFRTTQ